MSPLPACPKPLAWCFSLFLAMFGSACSSSDAEIPLLSQADFPERFANVWCQSVAPCCAPEQILYDPASCIAQARNFAATMLVNRVSVDTAYSASAGTRCLERLERALESCEVEEASTACALIFVGPALDGTPCSNGSACQSGYCALGEAALSGVCAEARYQSPNHGRIGDPCVGSCGVPGSFRCPTSLLPGSEGTTSYCYAEDGLFCGFDSDRLDALTCQPYAAIGASCEDSEARCIPGSFCADGTCSAQHSAGPCADTPDVCTVDSYCDAEGQCQPKVPNAAACVSGEECVSNSCSSDGACDAGNQLLAQACSGLP